MHGRKRVKPSAEAEKLRKEKEVHKIKDYKNLVSSCFQKRDKKEFDNDAFALTTKILSQNPDFYSIWNFRRLILLHGILKECSEEDEQQTLSAELDFLQEIFRLSPKSYWIFNHRRWCLETMQNPDWNAELKLIGKFLELDARNFHAWDYRRYVTSKLSHANEVSLVQVEFDFTTTKINQNFSNYSAWHQRSKLLPLLIKEKNLNEHEMKKLIDKEFELVKSAFYTDPDDQSAWLYYWWLIGKDSTISMTKLNVELGESSNKDPLIITSERIHLLKREISMIQELLELEPDSKWCLQTLAILLIELNHIYETNIEENTKIDEIIKICDHLTKIDILRIKRFEDLRSKVIFESETKLLVKSNQNVSQQDQDLIAFSLESKNLTMIPTPSILLYVSKLNLSNNKLTSMKFLGDLINLKEVNLSNNCITIVNGINKLKNLTYLDLRNNHINDWNTIKNGLIEWQGIVELNVYISGNPLIEIKNSKIEYEIKEISNQLKIFWE